MDVCNHIETIGNVVLIVVLLNIRYQSNIRLIELINNGKLFSEYITKNQMFSFISIIKSYHVIYQLNLFSTLSTLCLAVCIFVSD
jgi:hypothetical protein